MNKSSRPELEQHFHSCDLQYYPFSHNASDFSSYMDKIYSKAERFEMWNGKMMVGLVASYLNDDVRKEAFITSVSVMNAYRRKGIAGVLLKKCIDYSAINGFPMIKLKVHLDNPVIKLYKSLNFHSVHQEGSYLTMVLRINKFKE